MAKKTTASVDPGSLLSALTAGATKKEAAAPKKKTESYLEGGDELREAVEEYAASDIIAGIAEDQRKADGQRLKTLAFDLFVASWRKNGSRPENPLVTSPHASVRFQVKELYKPSLPPDAPKTVEAVEELLVQQGVLPEIAEKVVECVSVKTNLTTKPLDALLADGTEEEKEAAQALMALAVNNLSPAQKALLFETKPVVAVDAAKLSAGLALWCRDNPESMTAVLEVLPPQLALSQAKHDSALEVASRRFQEAQATK